MVLLLISLLIHVDDSSGSSPRFLSDVMSWWIRAGNEDGVMLRLHVGIFDDDSSLLSCFARALILRIPGPVGWS